MEGKFIEYDQCKAYGKFVGFEAQGQSLPVGVTELWVLYQGMDLRIEDSCSYSNPSLSIAVLLKESATNHSQETRGKYIAGDTGVKWVGGQLTGSSDTLQAVSND